jgi:hypothetical protein
MLMYWSEFSKYATASKLYSWKIGFHHFVFKKTIFWKLIEKIYNGLVTMRFLANDWPRERKGMYFACTRYYFPATLPNILFTFPLHYRILTILSRCQRYFCFSVRFGIYFPAANKVCEFIWKNCSYSGK